MLLRLIFAPKIKAAPPKDLLLFGPENWSFFFWSSPKVGQEKAVNFGEDLFSFGDHLSLTEKPLQSDLRMMKTLVKFLYCYFKPPKKPTPLQNPGYAPDLY